MHQHPRFIHKRPTSSQDDTSRSNVRPTEGSDRPPTRTRSSVDLASYTERAAGDDVQTRMRVEGLSGSQEKDIKRMNQIIQNFHTKAALTICASRASLPAATYRTGEIKQNRWFNLVLDDTDVLSDSLYEWKHADSLTTRPPPLVLEIYLDNSQLTHNQALVFTDEHDKRWDVSEVIPSSTSRRSQSPGLNGKPFEIVIERWTISIEDGSELSATELNETPPNVYKKGVVLFRSLYVLLRMLPAWKLHKRLARLPGGQQNLRLNYRIRPAASSSMDSRRPASPDTLFSPLHPSQPSSSSSTQEPAVNRQTFDPILCPAGLMRMEVEYRTSAAFSVAEAESLLSSRFMVIDGAVPIPHAAGKSLPGPRPRPSYGSGGASFGTHLAAEAAANRSSRGLLGAYGSLNTFHAPEKRASPVTELRQRVIYNEDDDEVADERLQAATTRQRSRLSVDLIKNPPFKAGSLTSTPPRSSPLARNLPSPSASTLSNYASSQNSDVVKHPQTTTRTMAPPPIPASAPTMLGQTKKYSSSFSDRKGRYVPGSAGSGFRRPEASEDASGGEDSRPTSGDLAIMGATPGSYSSRRLSSATSSAARSTGPETILDDMDSISQFLHDLDEAAKHSRESETPASDQSQSSAKVFSVDLGQFSKYRSSGSSLLQETPKTTVTPTPPSRRLSNVPPLSASPSPHALAHAPVVRSRLSTQSVAEETESMEGRDGADSLGPTRDDDDEDEPFIFGHDMD